MILLFQLSHLSHQIIQMLLFSHSRPPRRFTIRYHSLPLPLIHQCLQILFRTRVLNQRWTWRCSTGRSHERPTKQARNFYTRTATKKELWQDPDSNRLKTNADNSSSNGNIYIIYKYIKVRFWAKIMKRNTTSKGKQLRMIELNGSCAWRWNLSYTQKWKSHWELETWISNIKSRKLIIKTTFKKSH